MKSVIDTHKGTQGSHPARFVGIAGGVLIVALFAVGCSGGNPAQPSPGAVATVKVVDETFRIWLTDARTIAAARQAQAGGPARIPNGRIVAGTDVNVGWTWHLEDVEFAEQTIELCDGRPSDVERAGTGFGGGRFCPWSASVIQVVDGR
jgi:hypothetical protein